MILFAFISILASMGCLIVTLAVRSSKYDKMLIAGSLNSNAIAVMMLLITTTRVFDLIDIALIYACVNFVGNTAFLKLFSESGDVY